MDFLLQQFKLLSTILHSIIILMCIMCCSHISHLNWLKDEREKKILKIEICWRFQRQIVIYLFICQRRQFQMPMSHTPSVQSYRKLNDILILFNWKRMLFLFFYFFIRLNLMSWYLPTDCIHFHTYKIQISNMKLIFKYIKNKTFFHSSK